MQVFSQNKMTEVLKCQEQDKIHHCKYSDKEELWPQAETDQKGTDTQQAKITANCPATWYDPTLHVWWLKWSKLYSVVYSTLSTLPLLIVHFSNRSLKTHRLVAQMDFRQSPSFWNNMTPSLCLLS